MASTCAIFGPLRWVAVEFAVALLRVEHFAAYDVSDRFGEVVREVVLGGRHREPRAEAPTSMLPDGEPLLFTPDGLAQPGASLELVVRRYEDVMLEEDVVGGMVHAADATRTPTRTFEDMP